MVRPERFELPTFWFVGGFGAQSHARLNDNYQENQRNATRVVGLIWVTLAPVRGQKADSVLVQHFVLMSAVMRRRRHVFPAHRELFGLPTTIFVFASPVESLSIRVCDLLGSHALESIAFSRGLKADRGDVEPHFQPAVSIARSKDGKSLDALRSLAGRSPMRIGGDF
jgi:hypothetical protein